MADRYVLKPCGGLAQYPCASEEEALQKARELMRADPTLEVEILLNDTVHYDRAFMRHLNKNH
jgi:hypothetical protein